MRFGASFSRYFFTDYELHIEALFQFGSSRLFADHLCAAATICNFTNAISAQKRSTMVSCIRAWWSVADGSSATRACYPSSTTIKPMAAAIRFRDYLSVAYRAFQLTGATSAVTGGGTTNGALPQRFVFDPLRRHYLILSYSKPRIKEDWTIAATLIASLSDLSGTLSPTVTWSAKGG